MISSNYKAFCWFLSDVTKTLPIFWKQIIIFNERSKTDTNIFGHDLANLDIVWNMNVKNYVACNFHRGANVDKPSALSHYLLQ